MTRAAFALLLAALCASPLLCAQAAPDTGSSGSGPVLFAGFSYFFRSYAHTQLNPVSGGMPGWDSAISVPHVLSHRIGIVGDFSGHYQSSGSLKPQIYSVAGGPEFSGSLGRSRVYVHGLGGIMFATTGVVAQTSSQSIPIGAAGAGLDYPISSRLSWRVNFDWFFNGFGTNDHNHTNDIVNSNPRISTGPVLRF